MSGGIKARLGVLVGEIAQGQDCVLVIPYEVVPSPVIALAWGKQMKLEDTDNPGLERFIAAYQQGAQTPESRAACTGRVGERA
jgi:hypothetical protein